ncbi:MAG: helix-turn-helix transcriptional regulator [Actinomycetota bacterium]
MPRVTSDAAAHIGRRIAERRRQIALTQDELAAGSGIDSSNIRAYENGRAMPSIHSLVRIAAALGLDPGALLEGLSLDLFTARVQGGRRQSA